jgi:DNA-binding NtrC family response regulator
MSGEVTGAESTFPPWVIVRFGQGIWMRDTMLSVMFVDDEPAILATLRRCITPICRQWKLEFFTSPRLALAALDERPFEVIVSDMLMPEMDGAEFLDEAMRRLPQAIRIVLSGTVTEQTIGFSNVATHHFLPKPCNVRRLAAIIDSLAAVGDSLGNRQMPDVGIARIPGSDRIR